MKVMRSVGDFLRSAWQFVFCFRKVFLAIPVIVIAIILARQNAAVLPEQVGLLLSEEDLFPCCQQAAGGIRSACWLRSCSDFFMAVSRKVFFIPGSPL